MGQSVINWENTLPLSSENFLFMVLTIGGLDFDAQLWQQDKLTITHRSSQVQ